MSKNTPIYRIPLTEDELLVIINLLESDIVNVATEPNKSLLKKMILNHFKLSGGHKKPDYVNTGRAKEIVKKQLTAEDFDLYDEAYFNAHLTPEQIAENKRLGAEIMPVIEELNSLVEKPVITIDDILNSDSNDE